MINIETNQLTKSETDTYSGQLKNRLESCCCRYCGGDLILKSIVPGKKVEGKIEIFCDNCDRIEYGVEKDVYKIAKYFVEEMQFDYFTDLEEKVLKHRMNVAKICDIIMWGLTNLGYTSDTGLKYPIEISDLILGEDIIFTDNDLLKTIAGGDSR